MYLYLTIIVILVGILSLVGTLIVGKRVDKETEEYKKESNRTEAELKRSNEYEHRSLSVNLKGLTVIYVITFVVSIIALAVYIYFR